MENYLDSKAARGNARDIAAIVLCGLMLYGGMKVFAENIRAHAEISDILIDLILDALFAFGVWLAVFRIIRRRTAVRIAGFLYTTPEIDVSEDTLRTELGLKEPAKIISEMTFGGYLRNIKFDKETRTFHAFIKENIAEESMYCAVKCPSCGADCRIYRNRANICAYCGTELMFGENVSGK